MTRRISSFADTGALDDAALRELALTGEPHDRVLACWRLMIRGQALHASAADGPDAGIRRLLLINLAVARETELLAALVRGDPDVTARKEALVLLCRIDAERGLQSLRAALDEMDDEALRTILERPSTLPLDAVEAELTGLLERSSAELRRDVLDLLLAGGRVPAAIRRAAVREQDAGLRAHVVARWAASNDHAALLEHLDPLGSLALDALHAAGRRYSYCVLAPLLTGDRAAKVLLLVGSTYSPVDRRHVLDRTLAALASGEDLEPWMNPLWVAFTDTVLTELAPAEAAVVQLVSRRSDIPWDTLRPELERLIEGPPSALSQLAADVWLSGSREFPPAIQRLAALQPDPYHDWYRLDQWAASDVHRALLAAALAPGALAEIDDVDLLRSQALVALRDAGRRYARDELAPLAALLVDHYDLDMLAELIEQ